MKDPARKSTFTYIYIYIICMSVVTASNFIYRWKCTLTYFYSTETYSCYGRDMQYTIYTNETLSRVRTKSLRTDFPRSLDSAANIMLSGSRVWLRNSEFAKVRCFHAAEFGPRTCRSPRSAGSTPSPYVSSHRIGDLREVSCTSQEWTWVTRKKSRVCRGLWIWP